MKFGSFKSYFLAFFIWLIASSVFANNLTGERIERMDVTVSVLKDGSLKIREEIDYVKPLNVSKRGIFRELPRYSLDENVKVERPYTLTLATRNGQKEVVKTTKQGNIVQWRLGSASIFLEEGVQRYVLEYSSNDWIVRYDDLDEIRWNVMGEYWQFPVKTLTGRFILPEGSTPKQVAGYTGRYGSTDRDVTLKTDGNIVSFTATRPLMSGEGVTIAIGTEKGVFDALSQDEVRRRWLRKYGAFLGLGALIPAIFSFFFFHWSRVGRDPAKPPVFARYEAPKNYSAAASHRILKNAIHGDEALIATILSLAIKGRLVIDVDKKATTLSVLDPSMYKGELNSEEAFLFDKLFSRGKYEIVLKKNTPNSHFHSANMKFKAHLNKAYSSDYRKVNFGITLLGIILSVIGLIAVFKLFQTPDTPIFWVGVLALVICNMVFIFLMPAPTKKGARVKSEIEGFKLYLETAEKLRLNAAKVGTDEVPPMSVERYEAFLPYAVALDVEKPWSEHFEKTLPVVAENYRPSYYHGSSRGFHKGGVRNMSKDMTKALSAGVASARPVQTSSSSGSSRSYSGGGGFSGGGGGGGGGGSW